MNATLDQLINTNNRIMTRHGYVSYSFTFITSDYNNYSIGQYINIELYNGNILFSRYVTNNPKSIDNICRAMLEELEKHVNDRNNIICIDGIFYCTDNMSLDQFMSLCKRKYMEV